MNATNVLSGVICLSWYAPFLDIDYDKICVHDSCWEIMCRGDGNYGGWFRPPVDGVTQEVLISIGDLDHVARELVDLACSVASSTNVTIRRAAQHFVDFAEKGIEASEKMRDLACQLHIDLPPAPSFGPDS